MIKDKPHCIHDVTILGNYVFLGSDHRDTPQIASFSNPSTLLFFPTSHVKSGEKQPAMLSLNAVLSSNVSCQVILTFNLVSWKISGHGPTTDKCLPEYSTKSLLLAFNRIVICL